MKKRLISVLLATAMVFTNSTGVYAAAEEDLIFTGEDPEEELILTEEPSETEEASLEEEILPESPELETDQDSEEDPGEINIETTESPEEEEAEGENSPASFYPEEDQQHQTPAGYRQLDHDVKIRSLQRDNASGEVLLAIEDDLEDYYVTPNLPPLRNQGDYGTCWAFSTLALAEIGMMNNGELPSYYSPEYSKLHLAYFSYRTVEDPLGGTKGDYNSCLESGENILDVGGNVFLSENVLANWTGAAPEENLPYDTADELNGRIIDEGLAYDDAAHLQGYYDQQYSIENLSSIKNLIKKYGSVSMSFYAVNPFAGGADATIYNARFNSYYNPDYNLANHAMTFVGWDDNFPKENFTQTPPEDGAWLVRNSWKEGSLEDNQEYDGYFWMSYYEGSLNDYVHAFDFESADNYDNNYQYDGGMDVDFTYARKAANVFTSKAPGGAAGETLKAVGFYSGGAGADYNVYVYTDLQDADEDPESGRLVSGCSGTLDYAGFTTVTLDTPVTLAPGTIFSVVVELKDQPYVGQDESTRKGSFGFESEASSWYIVETAAEAGQSFIMVNEDGYWQDFGAENNCNIKIKAYTCDAEDISDSPIAPGEIVFDDGMDGMVLGVSESRKVRASVFPKNAANKKLEYISSDTSVVTVVNGYLYGEAAGTATITARALMADENGNYAQNSFNITVEPKLLGFTIDGCEDVEMGNEYTFKVMPIPKEAELPEDPYWISSDPSIASVDSATGVVKGHEIGSTLITALCGDTLKSVYVWVFPQAPVGLSASVDRFNNVTLTWDAAKGAQKYEIVRNGEVVKKISASSGKESYHFTDSFMKDDYESKEVDYAVRSVRKDFWICESVAVNTYRKIVLDADGGSCEKSYLLCLANEEPDSLPEPYKKGYSFNEWEKVSDTELVARYTPNEYVVSFDPNAEDAGGLMMDITFSYDNEEYLPENEFYREGAYDFAGWNTRKDGSGKTFADRALVKNLTSIDGDTVTLYAQWEEAKRTVTFETNGGSYIPTKEVAFGEMLDYPEREPVKTGSRFTGWFEDEALTRAASFPFAVTEDMTLYAGWKSEPTSIDVEADGVVLFRGTSEGDEGYSLELSADFLLPDKGKDNSGRILWTTSDALVAGFLTESGKVPVSRTQTDYDTGNKVIVAIHSEDTNHDGTANLWPAAKQFAYIYATSLDDGAVYGSWRVTIAEAGDPGSAVIDKTELIISCEGKEITSSKQSYGESLSVAQGETIKVTSSFTPSAPDDANLYYSSENMAVATVNSDGTVKGKSSGTTVIIAKNLWTGLVAKFRVNVYDSITDIRLSDTTLKVGESHNFEIKVSAVMPVTGIGDITFTSSNNAVVEPVGTRTDSDGRTVGIFTAKSKGKAVITASAGSAKAKCSVTVGNPVKTIEVNTGKGLVAVDKTLKIKAVFNGGNKKDQPLNKEVRWSVTNLDGTETDKAVIDKKTGALTAMKPGSVLVRAENTAESIISPNNDSAIVRIYVPVKKASLSVSSVSMKPGADYKVSVVFIPASDRGYGCTSGFDAKGDAIEMTANPEAVKWEISQNNYVGITQVHPDGACTLGAGNTDSKGTITLKASYTPYGATKPKTLSCKVKVTSNEVSKIALSSSKVTMGRGTITELSAILTPTAPEKAGVIWTIPEEYAKDICFMEGDEESEELTVATDLYENEGNKVRIKAKKTDETIKKKVKIQAETTARNKKGVPFTATCTVTIHGNANCIEFENLTYSLEKGKSFSPKAVAYLNLEESKTKSEIQKFIFTSSDVTVATVNKTSGKVKANGAGTATITATLNDGSGLKASFGIRVYEPVAKLTIDKTALYMGLKNENAENESTVKESSWAAYNMLTAIASPEDASDVSFTWTISNCETLESAVVDASLVRGVKNASEAQKIIASLDKGSFFGQHQEITTTGGQALALKATATGKVNVSVTTPGGKKGSCTVYISEHVEGINVITDFGASPGDGRSDNVAINEAIKKAHENSKKEGHKESDITVFVPGGVYDVSAYNTNSGSDMLSTGIHVTSGVRLVMDPDAILRVQGNNLGDYGVIIVQGEKLDYGEGEVVPDNIVISGGQIYGERNRHTGSSGESGHGVYLAGACNVTISDMTIYDNWGDGIYIGTRALFKASIGCRNITVKNCEIYNNRRNGISVVDLGTDKTYSQGLRVEDCLIRDCHGTAPQCGIYVEPNNKPKQTGYVQSEFVVCDTMYVKNTDIRAYQGKNDAAFCCFMTHYDPENSAYVTIRNITFEKCRIKGYFGNYSGRNLKLIDTSITGTKILGSNL